ncbi:hypothetical protein [Streptomyces hypolithicus]
MGALRRSRTGRITRTTRPTALLSAVAALLAAIFVCLGSQDSGPGAGAEPGPLAGGGPRQQHVAVAEHGAVSAYGAVASYRGPAYLCPYDSRHCGAFPHLSPAVLTAPPPATEVSAEPQRLAPPPDARPVRDTDALARAPGRHVLQVMRT